MKLNNIICIIFDIPGLVEKIDLFSVAEIKKMVEKEEKFTPHFLTVFKTILEKT